MVATKIQQALGRNAPYVEVLPVPVLAQRAPDSSDILPAGQVFIDQSVSPNVVYLSLGNGTFVSVSGGAGAFSTLSVTGAGTIGGALNVAGDLNLTSVATKISMNGGAVTDFIGTATLVAGTVTIANTNIAAGDRIMISRTAVNASTTLGVLTYSISAGASFTVTSAILGTPGSTQTGDLSSFSYVIFRQT